MNPFERYRCINAEEIIKANIRPNYIGEDSSSLLNALQPITYIASSEAQRAIQLHRNVIQKLTPKPKTLELLGHLGYELSRQGDYVYRRTSSNDEVIARENAMNEFQRFYNDLKKIKAGTLNGFEEFIQSEPSSRPQSRNQQRDDHRHIREESPRERLSSRTSSRTPSLRPSMPDYHTVERNNAETAKMIQLFKQEIKPQHNGPVVHSFIRRKLLLYSFKQKYPVAVAVGDQAADEDIDRRIGDLRRQDKNPPAGSTNEVYYECLLRANFDQDKALEILRHNRPDLQPPPEPENPRGPTTTTLENSLHCIHEQQNALTRNADENGGQQILINAGDEWKNTVHVVTAIGQLRGQSNNPQADAHVIDKMYRLIFSELSQTVAPQSILKTEILANALCEVPADSFEHLSMVDIRDIVLSCDNTRIPENFRDNVMKFLSTDCPICGGSYPRSYMEEMFLCSHKCCLDCVKGYYRDAIRKIKDPESLRRLTCFEEQHEITDDVKMNFFNFLGTKLNQWFTAERRILDLYHENIFMATRDSKDKKCGNQRCPGFFYNDNNQVGRAQCPHCQFRQCRQCCRKWFDEHSNLTCDQYADWLRDNDPEDPEVQLLKYLNTAGMACPNEKCRFIYEYQPGGCEHFTCSKCKTEFCRICSVLFYNPAHNTICPRPNCGMKKALHAHCFLNCYREIRDADFDEIIQFLTARNINVTEELRQKPQATGLECPVEGCSRAASVRSENRFCEVCYKEFLCLFVWRNEFEPWELYTENNLRQKLTTVSVTAPANATKPALIVLAQQHLTQFLGKPKKIDRQNIQ